ncbi:hypothetical protein DFH06DRAFT_1385184 [Mycena polygramma]|nr:hypothetical protein DFH06DRAFT_1385184 [Mycena polygramma]
MPSISLSDIPPELVSEILSFLDARTLLLCSSVCDLWHDIVKSSPELQYTVELWADGMVRGNPGVSTHAETLEALSNQRRAWKNLEWTSKTVIEIDSLISCRAYELAGGVFAQQQQGRHFLTISLSCLANDPENARVTHEIGIDPHDFQDFAIDPTKGARRPSWRDLMVFLYVPLLGELAHLELLTIWSHEPHPRATHPHLEFSLERDPSMSLSIQIVDDVLGLFFPDPEALILFNWTNGEAIAAVDLPISVADFRFLSARSYILAHACDDEHASGRIEIFTFGADCVNSPTQIAILELPELINNGSISSMTIEAGAFCAHPIHGTPFSKSNDNRIYMILILYNDTWCRLFVHYHWLHQHVLDHSRANKTEAKITFWDDWGPQNSRMLPGENHRWIRHVHGERVALPCPGGHAIQLLDFGIIPGHMDASPPSALVSTELHLEPSTLSVEGVFRNAVTTSLPYRSALRSLENEHDLFLVDQDRIIGLVVSVGAPPS